MAAKPERSVAGPRVLVVDDEKNIRATLALCLESDGCAVTAVASGVEALAAFERERFEIAFLDLRLADESGLDLLPRLLSAQPDLAIVVITAYATVETASRPCAAAPATICRSPLLPRRSATSWSRSPSAADCCDGSRSWRRGWRRRRPRRSY